MRANYNPEGRSYSAEDIRIRADEVAQLTAALTPLATELFSHAAWFHTAAESAAALSEEAAALLKDILAEMDEQTEVDAESSRLASKLSQVLAQEHPLPEGEWVDARGKDLARAMAGFWFNLGDSEAVRADACDELMTGRANTPAQQDLATLCARFYLRSSDALYLLAALRDRSPVPARMLATAHAA
jgi:hypothetical protein